MREDFDGEKERRPRNRDRALESFEIARDAAGRMPGRLAHWERNWLSTAVDRRLSFVNRRDESVDEVRRMSRIVLVWPMTATVLSVGVLLAADGVGWVLIVLSILYAIGAARRRPRLKRKLGETDKERAQRIRTARRVHAILLAGALILASVIVHDLSPVAARIVGILALLAHAGYRYMSWQLNLFVLSSTAIWRFQGLLDYKVSSLEYSKIQAGPNATSGMAAWLPIGIIEMDSAAQTGDLPMQRIGPVWGAEALAVAIFQRRKKSGQRVRIVDIRDHPLRHPRSPGS